MSYKVFYANLGDDPEVKPVNDTFVLNVDLAEDINPRGKSELKPLWYQATIYSKNEAYLRDLALPLKKGMNVLVAGDAYTDSYEDRNNKTQYTNRLKISHIGINPLRVETVTLKPKKNPQEGAPSEDQPRTDSTPPNPEQTTDPGSESDYSQPGI